MEISTALTSHVTLPIGTTLKASTLCQGRNREIFQRGGGGSHFSRHDFSFFPVEISILVDPEKDSVVSQMGKANKQTNKQKTPLRFFQSFFRYISHLPPSIFHFFSNFSILSSFPSPFSSFSSTFSIFPSSPCLVVPISPQKFAGGKSVGGGEHSLPFPLPPAFYATVCSIHCMDTTLKTAILCFERSNLTVNLCR